MFRMSVFNNILEFLKALFFKSTDTSSEEASIPAEEIIPENFNSAKALYALIEKLMDEN